MSSPPLETPADPPADAARAARLPPRAPGRRLLAGVVLSLTSALSVPLLFLAVLSARVGAPILLGLCLAGLAASWAGALWAYARGERLRRGAALVFALAWVLPLWVTLPAAPGPPRLVRDQHLPGGSGGAPWFGGIPEAELVALGSLVASTELEYRSAVEPGLFRDLYAEVARDPVAPLPSRTLDAWVFDRGHYGLALPPAGEALPAVVFLHGSAGPFHFYTQTLARPLTEAGFAVALPSWGWGEWDNPAGVARIEAVRASLAAHPRVDPERIYLAGLSNGAVGALHAFTLSPSPWRACAVISGAPRRRLPWDNLAGQRLWLLSGEGDERMRFRFIRRFAERAEQAGAEVELVGLDADHFAFLTHREPILSRLVAYLSSDAARSEAELGAPR